VHIWNKRMCINRELGTNRVVRLSNTRCGMELLPALSSPIFPYRQTARALSQINHINRIIPEGASMRRPGAPNARSTGLGCGVSACADPTTYRELQVAGLCLLERSSRRSWLRRSFFGCAEWRIMNGKTRVTVENFPVG
jgi:hypothetical protein